MVVAVADTRSGTVEDHKAVPHGVAPRSEASLVRRLGIKKLSAEMARLQEVLKIKSAVNRSIPRCDKLYVIEQRIQDHVAVHIYTFTQGYLSPVLSSIHFSPQVTPKQIGAGRTSWMQCVPMLALPILPS
jgi:hypothetical protein